MNNGTYVGIDVAKTTLDIAVGAAGTPWQVTHDGAGITEVVTRLTALTPTLIVLEATGGLEFPVTAASLPFLYSTGWNRGDRQGIFSDFYPAWLFVHISVLQPGRADRAYR